jgi:hypothetical protein
MNALAKINVFGTEIDGRIDVLSALP